MHYLPGMSTVQEIEQAIERLPREAVKQLREWIDDHLEDERDITPEFAASIERGKRDLADGTGPP